MRLLEIETSADALEPWLLSGTIMQGAGSVARFERNKVIACSGNWDVELTGQWLTFRRELRGVVLRLAFPPNEIRLERLDLQWPSGVRILVDAGGNILMENLRNTHRQTGIRRLLLRDNMIAPGRGGPDGFCLFRLRDGVQLGEMELSGNRILLHAGVADLVTLVDVPGLLSDDMLTI